MSDFELNLFEDNFFYGCKNEYNFETIFKNNKELNDSINFNSFPSFQLEECQQDMPNKDNHYNLRESKGIELNEEYDIRQIDPDQNDEDKYTIKKNDEEKPSPKRNKQVSSTGPTSDKKSDIKIKKVDKFIIQRNSFPNWRFDMVKKHFKSKISDYGNNWINELIQNSDLPVEFKKIIHKPNSLLFTANIKVSDNYHFLNDTLRTIFTIGKETEDLQKQNEENISNIYKHFGKIGNDNLSYSMRNIKDFFEMTYRDLITKFYDSLEFINFKEDAKTKFFNEGVIKQEKFSLLEDYGLIKLFMMIKKKRSRD